MSSLHKESKKNEQVLPKGGGWTLCLRRLTVEPRRDACAELGYGSSSIGNRAAAGGHRLLHGSYAQPITSGAIQSRDRRFDPDQWETGRQKGDLKRETALKGHTGNLAAATRL